MLFRMENRLGFIVLLSMFYEPSTINVLSAIMSSLFSLERSFVMNYVVLKY